MVVGGYGAVGQLLCRELARGGDLEVVVAGRRLEAAASLASELEAAARVIDLRDPATWPEAAAGVDLVVMCMDQQSTQFVSFLFGLGIDYVDVTASDDFFLQLERLPAPRRSAALLSVGCAPGLSNILAAHCVGRLDRADDVEIGMLFGLGDAHGDAALEWLAGRIFDVSRKRGSMAVDFGRRWGKRAAFFVDFSDQHALMRTLPINRAETRVCLESRLATGLLFGLAGSFAGSRIVRALTTASFKAVKVGSAACVMSVSATGMREGSPAVNTVRFYAENEALTTARLAALMIRGFLAHHPRTGIWHSHQIIDPATFLGAVAQHGIGVVELHAAVPASPA
jgi:hypothetical protein